MLKAIDEHQLFEIFNVINLKALNDESCRC